MSTVTPIPRIPTLGFCTKRLTAIDTFLEREVACGRIPGAVFRLAVEGREIYFAAYGQQDPNKQSPMKKESLFRTSSMTKYVTTLVALQACERGVLSILDRVERFLPKFANQQVLAGEEGQTERARQPISIKHLLSHTSGITYGQCGRENHRGYGEAGVAWDSPADPSIGAQEFVDRIADLPLAFQPHTRWAYGRNMEVLGRILEIVHDAPLDEVFRRQMFEPLGINDIFFVVPESMANLKAESPPEAQLPKARLVRPSSPPLGFASGGEGLISGTLGWGRLVDLILAHGAANGVSLLSPTTVDFMLSNHIGGLAEAEDFPLQKCFSYALGVYIRTKRGLSTSPGGDGEFGWWGGWGTGFWGDPTYGMSGVLMMQFPDEARYYTETLKLLSYQAIIPI
jgi:CubicO group peptidase (beta-lactamase class C family)